MLFTYEGNMTTNKKRHCCCMVSITLNFKCLHCARKNPDKVASDERAME